jgi:hypothetical protein
MIFRTTIYAAMLVAGLLVHQGVAAAQDCDGEDCPATAKAKPLDIMQFMREQAASTRTAMPRHSPRRPTAKVHRPVQKVHRPVHRAIAARQKPVQVPPEAAASFASPSVPPAPAAESNPASPAAEAPPAETVGAAVSSGPNVQLVDAGEFNDIDRKADVGPPPSVRLAPVEVSRTSREQTGTSWLRWIWSAVGSAFAALATAVHQLLRL